jgi:hypothetical protein
LSTRDIFCWGWDLARGKSKGADWTVGIALDDRGVVCKIVRFQAPWKVTYSRIIRETGRVPALVDESTYGDAFVEFLQSEAPGVFEGYNMQGGPNKQRLIEGLITGIKSNQVHFPADGTEHEREIRQELEDYEYVVNENDYTVYSAPEGQHDDTVIALALALYKLRSYQGGFLDTDTTEADVKAAEEEEKLELEVWTEDDEEEYHRREAAVRQIFGGDNSLWLRGRR